MKQDRRKLLMFAAFVITGFFMPVIIVPVKVAGQTTEKVQSSQKARSMNINIVVEGVTVRAVLEDNPASRDFVAMLPIMVTFEDFASSEKIAYLPKKLSTKDANANYDAHAWDVTYYIPWGNLAVFYKDYKASSDLIRLGRIVSNREAMTRSSPFKARIERSEN